MFLKRINVIDIVTLPTPIIPFDKHILIKEKKGLRTFYSELCINSNITYFHPKWSEYFNLHGNFEMIKLIYKACFFTVKDNDKIWLQYKILMRLLGTREKLQTMGLTVDPICGLCSNESESIIHLFTLCTKALDFWSDIKNWIFNRVGINLEMNSNLIILGYLLLTQDFIPINTLLITAKQYIFRCTKLKRNPNIYTFQKLLKLTYNEQLMLHQLKSEEGLFTKCWSKWVVIFND